MTPALLALIIQVGAPLVERIVSRRLGDAAGGLASEVIGLIADGAGTTPAGLEAAIASDPQSVERAIVAVEAGAPELIAVYAQEAEGRIRLLEAETREPLWVWGWRPLGMYGLGVLWFWNAIVLHIANAIWKTALPPIDWAVLLQISALYMSLYMGGHTVKAVVDRWRAGA